MWIASNFAPTRTDSVQQSRLAFACSIMLGRSSRRLAAEEQDSEWEERKVERETNTQREK